MAGFIAGVARFHRDVYPGKQQLFEKLSQGQSPEALFIACSDSRVDPALITQTDPGELFVCRNAGNLVPPYAAAAESMIASIEFAVAALGVRHIVVCGHTECGAMKGALNPESLSSLPGVANWVTYAQGAVAAAQKLAEGESAARLLRVTTEQNVLLQLEHLETHPSVAAKRAEGAIELHGWIYDIEAGDVHACDAERSEFVAIGERYAEARVDDRGGSAV